MILFFLASAFSFVVGVIAGAQFRCPMDPAVQIELIKMAIAGMSAIGAIAAAVLGWINRGKIHEVKILINGRLDKLLDGARAEGRLEAQQRIPGNAPASGD